MQLIALKTKCHLSFYSPTIGGDLEAQPESRTEQSWLGTVGGGTKTFKHYNETVFGCMYNEE